nr:hypothetical protein [Tanacetum cinerariifolium]
MAHENYVKECSMQRPPFLEPNGFFFCKSHNETYIKSKDIDLWQVIQNGDFYFKVEDSKTKLVNEMPYELLKDEQKKQLGKKNKAKMTLYNALPRKEYERVFMCKTAKERAKVMAIKEAKDSDTLPLDELIGNLKLLKAKVTREHTSDDSDSQGGSDEDVDEEEEEDEAFNLMARNFRKFFCKGTRFGHDNRLGNGANRFGRGCRNGFEKKGDESSKQKGVCYNYGVEGHFSSECRKLNENKAFVRGAWSDSEDGDVP